MDRRGFLRLLAAIPVIRHIPLPKSIYGSGLDGDLILTKNQTLSPYQWRNYGGGGAGGGGGGGGGFIVIFKNVTTAQITATGRDGSSSENLTEKK